MANSCCKQLWHQRNFWYETFWKTHQRVSGHVDNIRNTFPRNVVHHMLLELCRKCVMIIWRIWHDYLAIQVNETDSNLKQNLIKFHIKIAGLKLQLEAGIKKTKPQSNKIQLADRNHQNEHNQNINVVGQAITTTNRPKPVDLQHRSNASMKWASMAGDLTTVLSRDSFNTSSSVL